jgi:D-amino-acid dehydrogenase
MSKNINIVVIGAGIVGLSTALWLQRSGHQVTIIDQSPPGSGTSFGNAGVFADFARLPLSKFQTMCQIPNMLMDDEGPLSIQGRYIPTLIPYSLGYAKACLPENYKHGCNALTQLLTFAADADNVLMKTSGAIDLVRSNGSLALFGTKKGLEAAKQGSMQERIDHNVELQFVTPEEVCDLEPDLTDFHNGGVYYPNTRHTINPGGICQKYAEYFQENGGTIYQQEINHIDPSGSSITIKTSEQNLSVDRLVIAAGTASKYLIEPLGINVPLVSERGYHIELDTGQQTLSRPVSWLDKSVFLTAMSNGVRIAGTAEFAYADAPPDDKRIDLLLKFAKKMLGGQPEIKSKWVGSRPSTPDSLPIIGPLKDHPNIVLAFGHAHVGLTLSSITGKLVSQYIDGEKTSVSLDMFTPNRFL